MNLPTRLSLIGLLCTSLWSGGYAQTPNPSRATSQAADYIVAVVNSEPITNGELRTAMQRISREFRQQKMALPPEAELRREVLERLINERAQLQFAQETGIKIEEAVIDQAEQTVAQQNRMDLAGLHQQLAKDGLTRAQFRLQLKDQLTLNRLQERDVEPRLRISEADIDRALEEKKAAFNDPAAQQVNLAHLLISLPENATPEQIAQRQQLAQKTRERIRAGESFSTLVQEVSAADHTDGGQMGLRRADRYPPSFVTATEKLAVGEVSDIVRSDAGFHLLKVVERRAAEMPQPTVVQSHARHILLKAESPAERKNAVARLTEFKKRIESGAASFESVARQHSADSSAADGGDLGWVSPGVFVPEFEEPMNRLAFGEISTPVVSRFGVHLIQMLERKRAPMTNREVREMIRAQLRESRFESTLTTWIQEIRANTFVELR